MTYHYKTRGTCSTDMILTVEDGIIRDVEIWNGCNGNLQGISRLVRGMKPEEGPARDGLLKHPAP